MVDKNNDMPDKPRAWDSRDTLADVDSITRALGKGVMAALKRHKLLGNSIAVWEDGKVVIVPPEEIVIREDDE